MSQMLNKKASVRMAWLDCNADPNLLAMKTLFLMGIKSDRGFQRYAKEIFKQSTAAEAYLQATGKDYPE